jgi:hypothetical protein
MLQAHCLYRCLRLLKCHFLHFINDDYTGRKHNFLTHVAVTTSYPTVQDAVFSTANAIEIFKKYFIFFGNFQNEAMLDVSWTECSFYSTHVLYFTLKNIISDSDWITVQWHALALCGENQRHIQQAKCCCWQQNTCMSWLYEMQVTCHVSCTIPVRLRR